MATRYYPTKRSIDARFLGSLDGTWSEGVVSPYFANWPALLLSTTKVDGGQISFSNNKCNQQGDYDFPIYRFATNKLNAQTISGTLDICFEVWARFYDNGVTSDTPVRFKVHAYISTGDDPTPRAVLLDNYIDSVDWPPLVSAAWQSLASAQALTTNDTLAGDRIVVEIGARIVSSPTPTPTYPPEAYTEFPIRNLGTTNSSAVPWPDAVAGDTDANEVGWIEFSDNITEQTAPAAPSNETCAAAINIVAFPYQSAEIVTVSATGTQKEVWWKFTAPSTGLVLITTLGTNYPCTIAALKGADCGSALSYPIFDDIEPTYWSQSMAWLEADEGEQYFIRIRNSQSSAVGAVRSGGICRIALNYVDETLVNDDIYFTNGSRIYVYRDGIIVRARAVPGTCT